MATALRARAASLRVRKRWLALATLFVVTATDCHSPTTNLDSFFSSPACPMPSFVSLQSNAADWPCPPAEIIHEIDSEITVQFLADPTAGTLVCHADQGSVDLTPLQESAYQALYLLRRLQFDAPLPWTNGSLWTWFTASARVIQYFPPAACGPAGANDSSNFAHFGGGVMYLPACFGQTYVSGQGEVPLVNAFPTDALGMVHEARHAQKGHDCGSRDVNIPELGAWGVQYYFGLWLANHTTSPSLSAGERAYAANASELLRTGGGAFCTACGGI